MKKIIAKRQKKYRCNKTLNPFDLIAQHAKQELKNDKKVAKLQNDIAEMQNEINKINIALNKTMDLVLLLQKKFVELNEDNLFNARHIAELKSILVENGAKTGKMLDSETNLKAI